MDSKSSQGLMSSLRDSPATKELTNAAGRLLEAQAGRITGKLDGGVEALTRVADSGKLGTVGKSAGQLLQGKPLGAALTGAKEAVTNKVGSLVGGKNGKGKGASKPKVVNIEESIDVGVPLEVAYNQWTQFKDFSRFTKGVESVEQRNDTETTWRGKVFKSHRNWKAKIQEQVPDKRIVWTSEGPKGSSRGVVTFHPLAEDLTRVLVAIEYYPQGFVEKTANVWRAVGRRVRLDLKNYRRFTMLEGRATGAWRGRIERGKVVDRPPRKSGGRKAEPRKAGARKAEPRKATARNTEPRKATARKAEPPRKAAAARKAPAQKAAGKAAAKRTTGTRRRAAS
jgi:uncharacterized membrane protein